MRAVLMLGTLAVAGSLGGGAALAGVVITTETSLAGGQPPALNTISIDGDRMRMAGGRGGVTFIYRGDRQVAWVIHDQDRTYRELSPDSMQRARGLMDQARQKLEQQLPSMPADQRKRVEAMMAQMGVGATTGGGPPAPPTFEKAGGPRTVGSWPCTPYRVRRTGSAGEEACIARLSDVGLTAEDLRGMSSLAAFMQKGLAPGGDSPAMAALDLDGLSKAIGYAGVPIQTTRYRADGAVESQTTIKSIDRKAIAADGFELPTSYTKQDMPFR